MSPLRTSQVAVISWSVLLLASYSLIRVEGYRQRSLAQCDPNSQARLSYLDGEVADLSSLLMDKMMKCRENFIFSPLSLDAALTLVLHGAEGQSKEELMSFLKDPGDGSEAGSFACFLRGLEALRNADKKGNRNEPICSKRAAFLRNIRRTRVGRGKKEIMINKADIEMVNAIIYNERSGSPSQAYNRTVTKFYDGFFESFNPGKNETVDRVTNMINTCARHAGFESDIVKSSDFNDRLKLMIISGLGLKASWANSDFREHEGVEFFHNLDNMQKPVIGTQIRGEANVHLFEISSNIKPKGQIRNQRFVTSGSPDALVTELELAGGQLGFVIIQPKGTTAAAFDELRNAMLDKDDHNHAGNRGSNRACKIGQLCGKQLRSLLKKLDEESKQSTQKCHIKLPKFRLDNNFEDLRKELEELGLTSIFDPEKASLGGLFADGSNTYVTRVSHRAFIEVDKDGVKAAGVTMVSGRYKFFPMSITIDRPFIFVVRYKSMPLFVGQVVKL